MKNKFYKGVVPALATPLHKDETIDEEGLSKIRRGLFRGYSWRIQAISSSTAEIIS